MCGFFVSNFDFEDNQISPLLDRHLSFRGPDWQSGILRNNQWISYHARLSIIDLTADANQPLLNEDGSQLLFNGEILNFKQLGLQYFSRVYSSDTHLLNDLIRNELLNLDELDGFFAFVFIDGNGRITHACRDPFGVKPLYAFIGDNGKYTICSEPIVIAKAHCLPINDRAIEEYQVFRAPIFQGSFFKELVQVEPGSCLIKGSYFNPLNAIQAKALSDRANPFTDQLEKALNLGIESRTVADCSVGLLLSKGVDSNLIRHLGVFDQLFSIGFSGDEDFEYMVKQNFDNLTLKEVCPQEFCDAFDYLLWLRGEPLSVPNEVMLYLIAKRAKECGVKVLLSGEGADEFFGGYDRIFSWARSAKQFCLETFIKMYAYSNITLDSEIFFTLKEIFSDKDTMEPFEVVRWFFIRYHLPVLFRRLDFALMAAGVEGREPIANKHLFYECLNYGSKALMKDELGKIPLRDVLSKYEGSSFAYEKKVGFPVDLKSIFNDFTDRNSYQIWFTKNIEVLK